MKLSHHTKKPGIILYNGSTGSGLSSQSVAVNNGRIVAAGTNDEVLAPDHPVML